MPVCGSCAGEVELTFRYCPWCAAPVRRKLVEFFPARPFPGEIGKALRVSRYSSDSGEPGHVRFSVWNEMGVAEAVVSLDEPDAARLADFVRDSAPAACKASDEPGEMVTERLSCPESHVRHQPAQNRT